MLTWPKEVKSVRQFLPGGVAEYKLSHEEVGELGRIVLTPAGYEGCVVSLEVFAADDGLMMPRRIAFQEPSVDVVVHAALDNHARLKR